jgi:hypothetical protein
MKKGNGLEREVPILTEEKMLSLSTKQLLGRLKKLRYCEESPDRSDLGEDEVKSVTGILFKDTPEWKEAYETVKRILAIREHVPRRKAR